MEFGRSDLGLDVEFGSVEDWSFHSRRGATIQGRVYYPPDFDPEARYPAIVYYYGGTFPTQRTFGGRYPKNWWAGKGYVVYVLQPSGAVGFGQRRDPVQAAREGVRQLEQIVELGAAEMESQGFRDRS